MRNAVCIRMACSAQPAHACPELQRGMCGERANTPIAADVAGVGPTTSRPAEALPIGQPGLMSDVHR